MKTVSKNDGQKIPYTLIGTRLEVNGELTLDLAKYERNFAVHLDICRNAYGMLTMGTSKNYVAQIDIPARSYILQDDGVDDKGNPKKKKVPVTFAPDNATLTLWKVNA